MANNIHSGDGTFQGLDCCVTGYLWSHHHYCVILESTWKIPSGMIGCLIDWVQFIQGCTVQSGMPEAVELIGRDVEYDISRQIKLFWCLYIQFFSCHKQWFTLPSAIGHSPITFKIVLFTCNAIGHFSPECPIAKCYEFNTCPIGSYHDRTIDSFYIFSIYSSAVGSYSLPPQAGGIHFNMGKISVNHHGNQVIIHLSYMPWIRKLW